MNEWSLLVEEGDGLSDLGRSFLLLGIWNLGAYKIVS